MDALELLREMHVAAKAAFGEIQGAEPAAREALWRKLQPQLEVHEQIEERFVYDPVAAEAGAADPVLARWEDEHEVQVAEADEVIAAIDRGDPASDAWLATVAQLAQTLEVHIAHEENDIWPRIREAWSHDRLDQAGRQVKAAKCGRGRILCGRRAEPGRRGLTAWRHVADPAQQNRSHL